MGVDVWRRERNLDRGPARGMARRPLSPPRVAARRRLL